MSNVERLFLSACGSDQLFKVSVERGLGDDILKGRVHPPAPVMSGIGGNIDPLISGITLITYCPVNRQPVLQRQDTKHGRRLKMLPHDPLADPRLADSWSRTLTMEHLVEIPGSQLSVLFPPSSQRRSVMRPGRTN